MLYSFYVFVFKYSNNSIKLLEENFKITSLLLKIDNIFYESNDLIFNVYENYSVFEVDKIITMRFGIKEIQLNNIQLKEFNSYELRIHLNNKDEIILSNGKITYPPFLLEQHHKFEANAIREIQLSINNKGKNFTYHFYNNDKAVRKVKNITTNLL